MNLSCEHDAFISPQGDSQSNTSFQSSPEGEGEATGDQPRKIGISLIPVQNMESLESGMSSSDSEESLQAFSRSGGVSRESFALRRVRE